MKIKNATTRKNEKKNVITRLSIINSSLNDICFQFPHLNWLPFDYYCEMFVAWSNQAISPKHVTAYLEQL
jgi:hypothetical protein